LIGGCACARSNRWRETDLAKPTRSTEAHNVTLVLQMSGFKKWSKEKNELFFMKQIKINYLLLQRCLMMWEN